MIAACLREMLPSLMARSLVFEPRPITNWSFSIANRWLLNIRYSVGAPPGTAGSGVGRGAGAARPDGPRATGGCDEWRAAAGVGGGCGCTGTKLFVCRGDTGGACGRVDAAPSACCTTCSGRFDELAVAGAG